MAFLFFFKATYEIYRVDICITHTLSCKGMFLWPAVIYLLWAPLPLLKAEGSEPWALSGCQCREHQGWARAHTLPCGSCCRLWGLAVALWGWIVVVSPECVIPPSLHPYPSLQPSQSPAHGHLSSWGAQGTGSTFTSCSHQTLTDDCVL